MSDSEFVILDTKLEDCAALAKTMRPEQIDEVAASTGQSPQVALEECFKSSDDCNTAWLGDTILAIFGVRPFALLSDRASPWILTSVNMPKSPRLLMFYSKICTQNWLKQYTVLENYIDARYEGALRWARWLGFEVSRPQPYGVEGLLFCRIVMRRE